jgi:hypothetical protein
MIKATEDPAAAGLASQRTLRDRALKDKALAAVPAEAALTTAAAAAAALLRLEIHLPLLIVRLEATAFTSDGPTLLD